MTNSTKNRHDNKRSRDNDTAIEDEEYWLPVPRLSLTQAIVVVSVAACLCYWQGQFAEFTFDDNSAILGNADVRGETPFWTVFENDFWGTSMKSKLSHKSYRPLTVFTYRLNYMLANGYSAWGFHVVNLVLHAANCVLLLRVFSIFFGGFTAAAVVENSSGVFSAPRRSLLAGLLFAVHPIHTESVVAAVGRADLICAIFFNISLILYIKHSYAARHLGNRSNMYFALSILCAAVAMFSKEQGVTVLGVFLTYDVVMAMKINMKTLKSLLKTRTLETNDINITAVIQRMFIITFATATLLVIRLNLMGNGPPTFQKMDNPASFHPAVVFRVLNYCYLYSLNLWLLLCPWWLCFDWAMGCIPLIESYADQRLLCPAVMLLFLVLLAAKVLCTLEEPSGRFLLMALSMLVIPFLPAMNIFFRVGFVIAERNLYIPSVGFCLLVVHAINVLCSAYPTVGRKICKLLIPLLLGVFALRSMNRTNDWLTEEQLFKSGEDVCPLNAKVHYNIGKKSQDSGQIESAITYYKNAIRLAPDYDQPMNNLGNILKDLKRYGEAEYYLERAVNSTPTFATGWMNLGVVKAEIEKAEEAVKCYTEAVLHRRNYPDAYYNWGNLYLGLKNHKEALEKFEKAISLKNDHLPAWQNRVNLLCEIGHEEELLENVKKMTSIFPTNDQMMYLAGNSLARLKNYKESEKYLKRTIQLNPRNSDAHGALGAVYHALKDYQLAEKHYKHSLSLNPNQQGTIANYNRLQKITKKRKT